MVHTVLFFTRCLQFHACSKECRHQLSPERKVICNFINQLSDPIWLNGTTCIILTRFQADQACTHMHTHTHTHTHTHDATGWIQFPRWFSSNLTPSPYTQGKALCCLPSIEENSTFSPRNGSLPYETNDLLSRSGKAYVCVCVSVHRWDSMY